MTHADADMTLSGSSNELKMLDELEDRSVKKVILQILCWKIFTSIIDNVLLLHVCGMYLKFTVVQLQH